MIKVPAYLTVLLKNLFSERKLCHLLQLDQLKAFHYDLKEIPLHLCLNENQKQ